MELNKIYQGSALEVLKTFPNESIDCCITSPPYWNLRDYGHDGQLGLEKTFEEYIDKLMQIFAEVHRVLKPTGTVWINISDTYSNSGGCGWTGLESKNWKQKAKPHKVKNLPAKSLCGIPERFALAMTDRLGFIRRNTICWHKKNCMPSSASDRFTVDFEYLYFFTKQGKYYFEQMFEENQTQGNWKEAEIKASGNGETSLTNGYNRMGSITQGRNMRTVWQINTQPFSEAHFAVFPSELPRRCITAGCPKDICKKCGFIREKVYKSNPEKRDVEWHNEKYGAGDEKGKRLGRMQPQKSVYNTSKLIGYSTCTCNAGWDKGIVLDPFMGSGTTALVAKQLGRNWVGIELNSDYIDMANRRINNEPDPLF